MPKNNLRRNRQLRIKEFQEKAQPAAAQLKAFLSPGQLPAQLEGYLSLPQLQAVADRVAVPRNANDLEQGGIKAEYYESYEALDKQIKYYEGIEQARKKLADLKKEQKDLGEKLATLNQDIQRLENPAAPLTPPQQAEKTRLESERAEIKKQLEAPAVDEDDNPVIVNGRQISNLDHQIATQEALVRQQQWHNNQYVDQQKELTDRCKALKTALNVESLEAMNKDLPSMAAQIAVAEDLDPNFDINDKDGVTKSKKALQAEFDKLFQDQLTKWNLKYKAPTEKEEGKEAEPILSMNDPNGSKPTPKQIVDLAILKGWDPEVVEVPPKLAQGETAQPGYLIRLGRWLCLLSTPITVEDLTKEFNSRGIPVKVDATKLSPYQKAVNDTLTELAKGDPANSVPAIPKGQPVPFAEIYRALVTRDNETKAGLSWYQREKTHAQYATQYVNELGDTALGQIVDDLPPAELPAFLKSLDEDKRFNPEEPLRAYQALGGANPADKAVMTKYLNGLSPEALGQLLDQIPVEQVPGILKQLDKNRHFSPQEPTRVYQQLIALPVQPAPGAQPAPAQLTPAQLETVTRYLNGLGPKELNKIFEELPENQVKQFLANWHDKTPMDQFEIFKHMDPALAVKRAQYIPLSWWERINKNLPDAQPVPNEQQAGTDLVTARDQLEIKKQEVIQRMGVSLPAAGPARETAILADPEVKTAAAKVTKAEAVFNHVHAIADIRKLKEIAEYHANNFKNDDDEYGASRERYQAGCMVDMLTVLEKMSPEALEKVRFSAKQTAFFNKIADNYVVEHDNQNDLAIGRARAFVNTRPVDVGAQPQAPANAQPQADPANAAQVVDDAAAIPVDQDAVVDNKHIEPPANQRPQGAAADPAQPQPGNARAARNNQVVSTPPPAWVGKYLASRREELDQQRKASQQMDNQVSPKK